MPNKTLQALGMMSGSSLDGLDLACCSFTFSQGEYKTQVADWQILRALTVPYSEKWRERLRMAPALSGRELYALHTDYGHYLGHAAQNFLSQYELSPDLIASHGHTVFHEPAKRYTLQIGDGAAISALTGIRTIHDFRAQDVAAGGQGAPLAPLADQMLFPDYALCLNLGGIANLSIRTGDGYLAFDTGGANQILNALVQPLDLAYDDRGKLARQGKNLTGLGRQQDSLPYFQQPYPKSLSNDWVQQQQVQPFVNHAADIPDKLHTACRHIARQIAGAVKQVSRDTTLSGSRMIVTGGGAYNDFLIDCIREALPDIEVIIPESQFVDYKEAALMALMGCLRLLSIPNCLSSVTGATYDACGGAMHHGRTSNRVGK